MSTDAPQTPTPPAAPPSAAPAEAPAPSGHKIKIRLPYQRACNEKNAKGKLCAGHLKRWHGFTDETRRQVQEFARSQGHSVPAGDALELYRCEHCSTIYLPAPGFEPRTGTLQF